MSDSKILGGDDRIRRETNPSARADLKAADQPREGEDGTTFNLSERRRMLRAEWKQEALPTPPAIPGWHFVYLTTTNNSDPIHKRIRMGYEPVKASEVPGFEHYKVAGGEFDGCVSVNEMILFKIPEEIWRDIMMEFHHDRPNDEEELLRANAVPEDKDRSGRKLTSHEGEGFQKLGSIPPQPRF